MNKTDELMAKYADELKISGKINQGTICENGMLENTPITAMKNLFLMLEGKKPVWQPTDSDFIIFSPRLIPDNIARASVCEIEALKEDEMGGKDMFGIEWEYVPVAKGSIVRPGNPKVPDIIHWEDNIKFPDVDGWDWKGSAEKNIEYLKKGYPIYFEIMNGLFERLISFMEFENAAIAIMDDYQKEGVHRLFDKLCILYDKIIEHCARYFGANILYFHDDWGSQRSPFFSLKTCREMIMPYLKRVFNSAHKHGMYVDFHCCGKNEKLVPAMIEAGADIWYPQPINDFKYLYNTYGNNIILGIPLTAKDLSEKAAWVLAEQYMELYGNNHNSLPIISEDTNPIFNKYLYCLSREKYE